MDAAVLPYEPSVVRKLLEDHVSMSPSWRFAAVRLLANLLVAVVGVGLLVTGNPWAAVAGIGLMTVFYSSLMSGQHECLHRSLLPGTRLNDGLGLLMGTFMGVPYAGYRRAHLDHHAHTHARGDSEPIFVLTSVWQWVGYLLVAAHSVRASSTVQVFAALRSRNRVTRSLAVLSVLCGALTVAGAVALAVLAPRLLLLGVVIPWIVGSPLFAYITLAEHYGCAYGPAETLEITRTTTGSWFTRFLAWDANYHSEHHLNPAVPTSSLVAFHEVLEPYLVNRESSFVRFHSRLLADIRHGQFVSPPPWVDPFPASSPPDGDQASATSSSASREK